MYRDDLGPAKFNDKVMLTSYQLPSVVYMALFTLHENKNANIFDVPNLNDVVSLFLS